MKRKWALVIWNLMCALCFDATPDTNTVTNPSSNVAGKSFEELKTKAEHGNTGAQFWIGSYYYNGEGVAKNRAEAVKWWRKAAEQGNRSAQLMLGICYFYGQGATEDETTAVKWYRKAAEQGDACAQYWVGECYACGEGIDKDEVEAAKWYRKAAEQGSKEAQRRLGSYYYNGEGVAKDYVVAVKWWRKAAEQGSRSAQVSLGRCYYTGEGVVKDHAVAAKWYRKAAEQGDIRACYWLGLCYYYGNGVPTHYVEAHKWFSLASDRNSDVRIGDMLVDAKPEEFISRIEKSITSGQIAEAQRLAREFKPIVDTAMSSNATSAPSVRLPTQKLKFSDATSSEWPEYVSLTVPSVFPVVASGKQIGSVTLPVGTLVKIIGVEGDAVAVVYRNATTRIPMSATDFLTRVAAQRQIKAAQESALEEKNEAERLATEAEAAGKAKVAELKKLPWISGKILQVMPKGLLVHDDSPERDYYLVGFPGFNNVVEGEQIGCRARQDGRFQYLTVLGASRTIGKWIYCGEAANFSR